jgi:uncharacterized membrane protein YjdF
MPQPTTKVHFDALYRKRTGWVNASRAEKFNQIKHLADVLQANLVLNEGLARGYESEVLADFLCPCSWGISRIAAIAEQI